jgi:hypothetical protein
VRVEDSKLLSTYVELEKLALERDKLQASRSRSVLRTMFESPVTGPVLVALIGLLAAVVGGVVKSFGDLQLQREKFRSELIFRATSSPDSAAERLRFLVRAELLDIDTTRIFKQDIPSFPSLTVLPSASAEADSLASVLMGSSREERIAAGEVLITQLGSDSAAARRVIENAVLHWDDANAVYNAVRVLNEMQPVALRPNRERIMGLIDRIMQEPEEKLAKTRTEARRLQARMGRL